MDELSRYISELSSPEDELLQELDRETNLRVVQPRMISGHLQGKFLEFVTRCLNPRHVLEIGTFTGYSTLCIAAGLGNGSTVDTIEVNDELESLARSFFDRSPSVGKIKMHIGSALDIAPRLGLDFGMVFIDGDKRQYPDYYRMVMGDSGTDPLVVPGSVIIADNILWYGKVTGSVPQNDRYTRGILEFNEIVRNDPRVDNFILPIRDGLNMIIVK